MKVVNPLFGGAQMRAGRCGCVCSYYYMDLDAQNEAGYKKYGCSASCIPGNNANNTANWNGAINHN